MSDIDITPHILNFLFRQHGKHAAYWIKTCELNVGATSLTPIMYIRRKKKEKNMHKSILLAKLPVPNFKIFDHQLSN